MSRAQKLKWYAEQLMTEAAADEKSGKGDAATKNYLQAADILLLLAKVEPSYPVWKHYTDNAALCQRKARQLIALEPKDTAQGPQAPPAGPPPRP